MNCSMKGKISNFVNKNKNSVSKIAKKTKKASKVKCLRRKFIEDDYHFNNGEYFEGIEDRFSLLNFPSTKGMSHNYDDVQDNEVTSADYYRNHQKSRQESNKYPKYHTKNSKIVQHSLMNLNDKFNSDN